MERTRKRARDISAKEVILGAVRGTLIGLIFTVAAVLVFALIIKGSDISDAAITTVNQVIKILGAVVCAIFAVRGRKIKRWLLGGASGLLYAILCYLIFSAVDGEMGSVMQLLSDTLLCTLAGVVIGCVSGLVRLSGKRK